MDYRDKISNQLNILPFRSTCPALPPPAPSLGSGLCGMRRSPRVCPLPGGPSPAISVLPRAPAPRPDWPFISVAYCFKAHSRLGFSANFNCNAAYHTTFCKFRGYTNRCPDKKSGRPAVCSPRPPAVCLVGQWRPTFFRRRTRWPTTAWNPASARYS